MTHPDYQTAETILAEFLAGHPEPSRADWRMLISAHPEHASEIADFDLASSLAEQLNASDELDAQLISRTMAHAFDLIATVNETKRNDVEALLAPFRGPAASELANAIGLKGNISLLNSVVFGRVSAPLVVVRRIAKRIGASTSDLLMVFAERFEREQVAFKASSGKPTTVPVPDPWDEAVKAEALPPDDERALLALMDANDPV
jgi:protein-tyrosine-phosphatase